jgi:hypothetical protein
MPARYVARTLRDAGANSESIANVVAAPQPLSAYWRWWEGRLANAQDPVARVHRAMVHAALDRPDHALDDLEAAAAAGYRMLPFHLADPRFDGVRASPRFIALLEGHGLPASGATTVALHDFPRLPLG